jgi:hypothetical protein
MKHAFSGLDWRPLALGASLIAFGVFLAWRAVQWATTPLGEPPPALAAGIPSGTWKQTAQTFTDRIIQRFPLGSPEQALVTELEREGFDSQSPTPGFWDRGEAGVAGSYQNAYGRSQATGVCDVRWSVYWDADTEARLTRIDGAVSGVCL